jgi:hypothetical protein
VPDDVQIPNWLVPGAEVMVYDDKHHAPYAVRTTVKKVATKSFSVTDDRQPRFPIKTLAAWMGGAWGWHRRVAPIDSDEARAALLRVDHARLMSAATLAVDTWERARTRENRLAAIAALQAVENDEEPERGGRSR